MKHNLKKLVALLLAALLLLSVAGLSEEAIVIGEGAAVGGASGDGIPAIGDLELEEQLDISDILVLDADVQTPAGDEAIAPEADVEGEIAANALVKKVKLGVNEKYTIDTSSLRGNLTFKSSKPGVASVSKKGVIKGKKAGTAKITITTAASKKYMVAVTVANAPSKVTLDRTSADLNIGATLQLKATLPNKTASNRMTWTSSNKNVATVSDNGKVTAKAAGTATITVTTFNDRKATCDVTVKKGTDQPSVTVDKTSIRIMAGDTSTIKVTFTGSDTMYWEVNKAGIVACEWGDEWYEDTCNLKITGKEAGQVVVEIRTFSGASASINVTVIGSGDTGDILSGFGTNVDNFRNILKDALVYYEYDEEENCDVYHNDYMMVYASASNRLVTKISLIGNTRGKYTLCGIHPGIDFSTAQDKASAVGWKYRNSDGDNYYYTAKYKDRDVILTIEKRSNASTVKSVTVSKG